jgi:hypothetical protein
MRALTIAAILVWTIPGTADAQAKLCFPPAATHAQMRNVVVQGLQAHPEEQHEAPEILGTKYLSAAFPCPQSK